MYVYWFTSVCLTFRGNYPVCLFRTYTYFGAITQTPRVRRKYYIYFISPRFVRSKSFARNIVFPSMYTHFMLPLLILNGVYFIDFTLLHGFLPYKSFQ